MEKNPPGGEAGGTVKKRLRRGYCPYPIRLGSHVLIAGT